MSREGFWDDQQAATRISQQASDLKSRIEEARQAEQSADDLTNLWELLRAEEITENQPEWQEFEAELSRAARTITRLEIESLLDGEHDNQAALVTVHAGAGGVDSCDWAEMLYRMYFMWSQSQKYNLSITDERRGDVAGIQTITFRVAGRFAYGYLKVESGVHRLIRISPFDKNNKRHTSFAAVDVIPELPESIDVEVNEDEIKVDTYRASGAGGQHVNKTSSAVRLTHLPTGIIVTCQNERSQLQNKEVAMRQLKSRLVTLMEKEHKERIEDLRGIQSEIAWGSQIRNYFLHPYQLIKDVRSGYETSNAQRVLDGDLTPLMWSCLRWLRQRREE
jgi:peptide chain release factor 2